MRRSLLLLAGAAFVLFVFSCSRGEDRAEASSMSSPSPAMDITSANGEAAAAVEEEKAGNVEGETMSSSAARTTGDTSRRFIRTADLRFRVKDVVKATYSIEDLIAGFGGHVEHTELTSRVDNRYTTPISADSLLETTKFTVMNRATLRVPASKLDTALKSLAQFVDFLDHRTVDAQDVRLLLMANRMTQQRVVKHEQRLTEAIDEQGKKLRETVTAEDRLLDRQEQADEARLSNLGLEDRIAYSTIVIDIYQRQSTRHELLADERNIDRYEPGFFSELGDALHDGWKLLVNVALFLARSWSVILIMAVIFLALRKLFRSKPQSAK